MNSVLNNDGSDISIREVVLKKLKNNILTGRIKPGERMVEMAIAKEFGVSRTPVREALRQLESEGLAINIPRRGTIVKGICPEEAAEMYDIREVLEGLAARLACLNITRLQIRKLYEILDEMEELLQEEQIDEDRYVRLHDEYNRLILEATHNKSLLAQTESVHEYLKSLRFITLTSKSRRILALSDHRAIVAAIEEGDENNAENVARAHVRNAKNTFKESIEKHA